MSAEMADSLFREYAETRKRRTRNKLVEAHIGFANHVARRYTNRGVADEDLRQVALLALVKAVDRFDPEYGAAFTSFAGRTIEGEIKRHFRDATWAVRVPRSAKERHLLVRRATDELHHTNGRSPTPREIASHLDLTLDEVVEALGTAAAFSATSLDQSPGTMAVDHSDRLRTDDAALEGSPDRMLVEQLLASLPEREQQIVRLRFFDEMSQAEIADVVGVSQMHVSRLLRRSLTLMREQASEAATG